MSEVIVQAARGVLQVGMPAEEAAGLKWRDQAA